MRAPHIYFNFRQNYPSTRIQQEVCIPYSTPGTFYSVLNWNAGDENFGGYASFQMLINGTKTVHFSLWYPQYNREHFKVVYGIEGGQFDAFTNEKTGRKFVAPFNFQDNEWYSLKVSIEYPDKDNTLVHFHIVHVLSDTDNHVVSINYPVSQCRFLHSYGTFLEDFSNTTHLERKLFIKNGFLWNLDSLKWIAWSTQELSFNPNGALNLNGGVADESFFLESGGSSELQAPNYSIFSIKSPLSPEPIGISEE